MYTSIKALSVLALAGSTFAAPSWGNWGSGSFQGGDDNNAVGHYAGQDNTDNSDSSDNSNRGWGNHGRPAATVTEVATATAYTTVFQHGSKPTEAPQQNNGGQFYGQPNQGQGYSEQPSAPAPSSGSTPSAGSSSGGYMGTVDEWRSKMGMSALTEDGTLQANAEKTAADGKGQMVHQLNPGSMAQVLAPGDCTPDEFVKVFVGGWLCEVPSLPGLDGICSSMSAGWDYAGQTGHADILSSKAYSKIGCACAGGIWSCDLA